MKKGKTNKRGKIAKMLINIAKKERALTPENAWERFSRDCESYSQFLSNIYRVAYHLESQNVFKKVAPMTFVYNA